MDANQLRWHCRHLKTPFGRLESGPRRLSWRGEARGRHFHRALGGRYACGLRAYGKQRTERPLVGRRRRGNALARRVMRTVISPDTFAHGLPSKVLESVGATLRTFFCSLLGLFVDNKKMEENTMTKERNSRHDCAPLHLPPEN